MGLRSSNYFTQVLPVCMTSWKNKFFFFVTQLKQACEQMYHQADWKYRD